MERHAREVAGRFTEAVACALGRAELEAGSRFAALFPFGTGRGVPCDPGVVYPLAQRGPDGVAGSAVTHGTPGFDLQPGQRLLRLMTHPEDARAGWHVVADSIRWGGWGAPSVVQDEVRFDTFHWAFGQLEIGIEGHEVNEVPLRLYASAVLRAPEPRPMVHGFWVKFYTWRCSSPAWPVLKDADGRLVTLRDGVDLACGVPGRWRWSSAW